MARCVVVGVWAGGQGVGVWAGNRVGWCWGRGVGWYWYDFCAWSPTAPAAADADLLLPPAPPPQLLLQGVRRINVGGKALTNYLKELVSYRWGACLLLPATA